MPNDENDPEGVNLGPGEKQSGLGQGIPAWPSRNSKPSRPSRNTSIRPSRDQVKVAWRRFLARPDPPDPAQPGREEVARERCGKGAGAAQPARWPGQGTGANGLAGRESGRWPRRGGRPEAQPGEGISAHAGARGSEAQPGAAVPDPAGEGRWPNREMTGPAGVNTMPAQPHYMSAWA
jgi:hypothetical protein